MNPLRGYHSIGDYAIIGDGRTVALVARDGSVDWLCLPRIDSPSVFGAMLDNTLGGRFRVAPTEPFETGRRYLPETNVLETTFTTDQGVLRVTDCMTVQDGPERDGILLPDHELLRTIECLEGVVKVEVHFDPRPRYGRVVPRLRRDAALGAVVATTAGSTLALQSELPLRIGVRGAGARGVEHLGAGDRRFLSLTFEQGAGIVAGTAGAADRLQRTTDWWRRWCADCAYDGPHREAVLRSLLTLKLLIYAPSGAVVAAPTTSLPERLGGAWNWDYRFCWLRDASMTLRAFFDLGFMEEGAKFLAWMLQATRTTWPKLQVMYSVYGESDLPERLNRQWEGYAASSPVRIGNAAHAQHQFDVYGEVITAAHDYVRRGGVLDRMEVRMIRGLGDTICQVWREPDAGIWESRGGPRHHTLSKVMCWVGLDHLIRMHEDGFLRVPVDRYRAERNAIRQMVESRGWNEKLGSYVSELDGDRLDASLLMLSLYGYAEAGDERMRSTCDRIYDALGRRDCLLFRYAPDHADVSDQGAFGICSFWGVEALARRGDDQRAREKFDQVLAFANDVGLMAEEIDPETGAALGNFPQAFTHVGLINAAVTLRRLEQGEQPTRAPGRRTEVA
ncbi:MAG: glycoside hydrolase family 15 protein [Gemmatimonadota bacterium]|jgi:GH15 family glucan-1,4-alpha-glucosidase